VSGGESGGGVGIEGVAGGLFVMTMFLGKRKRVYAMKVGILGSCS